MPGRRRSSLTRHYYHVIHRGAARPALFTTPREYREFLAILREGLTRHHVPLVAYIILPTHWHLLLGPTGTTSLSRLLHWVTTTHAVRFRLRRKTAQEDPVYLGRFDSQSVDAPGSLVRICRHVERHALTAGLVRRAQDWPWGSLADRRRDEPAMPLSGSSFLVSDTWLDHVNAVAIDTEQLHCGDASEPPGFGAERRDQPVRMIGRADQHQPDTHVERAKHLRIVKLSATLKPLEQRRNRPTSAIK